MAYKILAINPGSTSTKIAIFEDDQQIFVKTIRHSAEEIEIGRASCRERVCKQV